MLAAHREWDRVQGAAGRAHGYTHVAQGGADKRLRIGYVSPDFRRHSVSYFFAPILAHHDRDKVEVYCYAEVNHADEVTQRLQGAAEHWFSTVGLSDEAVARQIHEDGIDILIDLAGHTRGNRLGVFTYKPAPIQATYLGYFTGTGLAAMDYWLTDEVMSPLDTIEATVEEPYRLPRSCVVYQAPAQAPAVVARSAEAVLTFGSFNDLSKLGPRVVPVWSEILRRVPASQLLIKAQQLAADNERTRLLEAFAAEGIGPERLELRSYAANVTEHLAQYGEVDIALDAMPRTGGTTTAEALWMGVPVVSLAGRRFIERLSASMLEAVGLSELVSADEAGYIETAVALAAASSKRAVLRQALRSRMLSSPLCDAAGLAQALEEAYRHMWRRWLG
jgi:predicted O-linked N-acetylglucosamine transferase (SPINDLY family)